MTCGSWTGSKKTIKHALLLCNENYPWHLLDLVGWPTMRGRQEMQLVPFFVVF
jgi:hypothetical protein